MISEIDDANTLKHDWYKGDSWVTWLKAAEYAQANRQPLLLILGYELADNYLTALAKQYPAMTNLFHRVTVVYCHRRERTDLAQIYYRAAALLNGEMPKTWPLWLMIDPDTGAPFFATDDWPFVPNERGPTRLELIQRLTALFHDQPEVIRQQNAKLAQALRAGPPRHGDTGFSLQAQLLETIPNQLITAFRQPTTVTLSLLEYGLHHLLTARDSASWATELATLMRQQVIYQWQQQRFDITQIGQLGRWLMILEKSYRLLNWRSAKTEIERLIDHRVLSYCNDNVNARFLLDEALLITALFPLGQTFEKPAWQWLSQELLSQVQEHFDRHQYWRVSANDHALHAGLDEMAYLLKALVTCGHDASHPITQSVLNALTEHYMDASRQGGFYTTHDELQVPIGRQKSIFDDDDLAASGGIATALLLNLGRTHNHLPWLVASERALKNAWPTLERQPLKTTGWLVALEQYFAVSPPPSTTA